MRNLQWQEKFLPCPRPSFQEPGFICEKKDQRGYVPFPAFLVHLPRSEVRSVVGIN